MQVQWWGIIPFVVMLGTIAIAPLVPATRELWERQRVQLQVSLILGLPVAIWFLAAGEETAVVHALIEYGQFITLLFALFVVSGGIFLAGDIKARPAVNTTFIGVGAVLASFIGTTGAAMLLIRPLLNTNAQRKHRVHTVLFAIFIVANTGGLLTPLGDPPLFLGYLRGVPFTWTFNLYPHWLFVNVLLLLTYYGLERRLFAQEPEEARALDRRQIEPLRIRGGIHSLFLALIVLSVAFVPSLDLAAIEGGDATWWQWVPWREIVMVSVALLSLRTGPREARYRDNRFTWGPIQEVAAIFIGIFLTMIPALRYLAQIAPELPLNRMTFFYFTGGLSSVLDNAPTYVTFFEMARQLPGEPSVAGIWEPYLISVSLGAVFFGAVTYIGNGPNFMVKAVADSAGVRMPSFGGYVLQAFRYLVPILVAMSLIFLNDVMWAQVAGWVLTVLLVLRSLRYLVLTGRRPAPAPDETTT